METFKFDGQEFGVEYLHAPSGGVVAAVGISNVHTSSETLVAMHKAIESQGWRFRGLGDKRTLVRHSGGATITDPVQEYRFENSDNAARLAF